MADLLTGVRHGPSRLRELLAGPEPVIAPGAYDSLSARLIEMAGFPAVYMTGYGTAASLLGRPDVGLLTMTEMVGNASRIVQATSVPVIADADDGYGNPLNVIRTVKEYERAGVAGIHLEDQVAPKRCGHLAGKEVVSADVMVQKVRAAVEARGDPDFVIIARTDARAVEGLDAALERARRYVDAGADVLFVEAPEHEHELETVAKAFSDVPLVFNWVEGGRTPPVPLERVAELGFRLVLFPVGAVIAAAGAVRDALARLSRGETPVAPQPSFDEFIELIGLRDLQALELRFAT
jgi:carboxyvinyl-carboxyphosphonate phosphorylmutase